MADTTKAPEKRGTLTLREAADICGYKDTSPLRHAYSEGRLKGRMVDGRIKVTRRELDRYRTTLRKGSRLDLVGDTAEQERHEQHRRAHIVHDPDCPVCKTARKSA